MSPILTPSREVALDLWLTLVLLGLSPAMLASWLQTRFPEFARRLPIDWYGVVLVTMALGSYFALGTPPRLLSSLTAGPAILLGLALGAAAVGVELAVLHLVPRASAAGREASRPRAPADVPIGDAVVWRLRDHGPAWNSGLANLMVPAVLEELIYRQALLALMTPAVGLALAVVVSTFSFGLIHLYFGVGAVLSKWLIGGLFVVAILAGAGLLSVILAHCVLNGTAFALRRRRPAAQWSNWAGRRA